MVVVVNFDVQPEFTFVQRANVGNTEFCHLIFRLCHNSHLRFHVEFGHSCHVWHRLLARKPVTQRCYSPNPKPLNTKLVPVAPFMQASQRLHRNSPFPGLPAGHKAWRTPARRGCCAITINMISIIFS